MSTAKRRNTAGLKPFQKGPDSRRWKHGQKSKAAVAATRDIQQWLSSIGEEIFEGGQTHNEALCRKIWEKAIRGDMQAAVLIMDRILGKAPQPISGALSVTAKLSLTQFRESMKGVSGGA